MDVTRIYKSIRLSIAALAEVHSSIQRIWKTVGKHPGKLAVLQKHLYTDNLFLHGSGTEKSLFLFRTVRGIVTGRYRIILHGYKARIGKKAATIDSLNHPGSRSQDKAETNLFGIKTHISSI